MSRSTQIANRELLMDRSFSGAIGADKCLCL